MLNYTSLIRQFSDDHQYRCTGCSPYNIVPGVRTERFKMGAHSSTAFMIINEELCAAQSYIRASWTHIQRWIRRHRLFSCFRCEIYITISMWILIADSYGCIFLLPRYFVGFVSSASSFDFVMIIILICWLTLFVHWPSNTTIFLYSAVEWLMLILKSNV